MTQVKIVTDSSVTIEPEVVKELNITVVPLSVMIDSVLYSDADLKEGEFLHLIQQSKTGCREDLLDTLGNQHKVL